MSASMANALECLKMFKNVYIIVLVGLHKIGGGLERVRGFSPADSCFSSSTIHRLSRLDPSTSLYRAGKHYVSIVHT